MIKFETRQVINVSDFDDLVTKTYRKPYKFQQQEGCQERGNFFLIVPNNDAFDFERNTIPEEINGKVMGVSFAAWLARSPHDWNGKREHSTRPYLEMFWERNFYPNIQMIANDLHSKGLFPAGEYTIEIDW